MASCRPSSDPDVLVVRMTGDDYRWGVRYPGRDGRLDTRDDVLDSRNLNVPEGTEVRVLLESRDYVYTLAEKAWNTIHGRPLARHDWAGLRRLWR